MLRQVTAALVAGFAILGTSAAGQTGPEVLFQGEVANVNGHPHWTSVSKTGTRCSLVYLGGAQGSGFALSIGATGQESRFIVVGDQKLGDDDDSFRLARRVGESWSPFGTTRWKVSQTEDGQYVYEASPYNLRLDYAALKPVEFFRFQANGTGDIRRITFSFYGELRDQAVAAMDQCLASQDSYWTR